MFEQLRILQNESSRMSQWNERIWTGKETATRKISEERNIWNSFFATVKRN